MTRIIIIKHKHGSKHHHDDEEMQEKHEVTHESRARESISRAIASMDDYDEYVKKHGAHFTDDLADWASKQMDNAHGDKSHHWSTADVKSAFERLGYKKPEESTWGDAAYSANMHYADYFGESLKTEADCIKQAYADVTDPDGYPGKVFNRWAADVAGKKMDVPWDNFI